MKIYILLVFSLLIIEQIYTCYPTKKRGRVRKTNVTRPAIASSSTKISTSTKLLGVGCEENLLLIPTDYELPCEPLIKPCYHNGTCVEKCIFVNTTHMKRISECNCTQGYGGSRCQENEGLFGTLRLRKANSSLIVIICVASIICLILFLYICCYNSWQKQLETKYLRRLDSEETRNIFNQRSYVKSHHNSRNSQVNN